MVKKKEDGSLDGANPLMIKAHVVTSNLKGGSMAFQSEELNLEHPLVRAILLGAIVEKNFGKIPAEYRGGLTKSAAMREAIKIQNRLDKLGASEVKNLRSQVQEQAAVSV